MKINAIKEVTMSTPEKIALERYVFKPLIGSSHSWALKILNKIPPTAKVLDIGPGSGFVGKTLGALPQAKIYAIEPDTQTAEQLIPFYTKIYQDLKSLDQEDFDLVILMDVLEHMAEPEKFLAAILPRIKPQGQLLISVPNVAHWSVRLPLLFGFFEYKERGPLDKTHLQFFSNRRFKSLLNFQGQVKPLAISASIEPAELVLPKALYDNKIFQAISLFRIKVAETLPGLFAYQFLVQLEKK